MCQRSNFLRRPLYIALGKINCMSSVHELIPLVVNCAASKGAIIHAKPRSRIWRPKNLNSICPGAIQTPINRAAWETPEAFNSLMSLIPVLADRYWHISSPLTILTITGSSMSIDRGIPFLKDLLLEVEHIKKIVRISKGIFF